MPRHDDDLLRVAAAPQIGDHVDGLHVRQLFRREDEAKPDLALACQAGDEIRILCRQRPRRDARRIGLVVQTTGVGQAELGAARRPNERSNGPQPRGGAGTGVPVFGRVAVRIAVMACEDSPGAAGFTSWATAGTSSAIEITDVRARMGCMASLLP